jgi:hypothetical protein
MQRAEMEAMREHTSRLDEANTAMSAQLVRVIQVMLLGGAGEELSQG